MESITITFKDGRPKATFSHRPRAGGSWTLHQRYEGAFFIVVDEFQNETAFPSADILEVRTRAERGRSE